MRLFPSEAVGIIMACDFWHVVGHDPSAHKLLWHKVLWHKEKRVYLPQVKPQLNRLSTHSVQAGAETWSHHLSGSLGSGCEGSDLQDVRFAGPESRQGEGPKIGPPPGHIL